MSQARDHALPDRVLEQAKWHVLDTVAAMISGSELAHGPGRDQVRPRLRWQAGGDCRWRYRPVRPDRRGSGERRAKTRQQDGKLLEGGWHPGCNVVPAALAAGEQFGISGAHFLRAVALGYDIGARVLITVRAGLQDSQQGDPRRRRRFRGRGGGQLRGELDGARDALDARLRRAAVVPASRRGTAIRTISKRASCSAACRRAVG